MSNEGCTGDGEIGVNQSFLTWRGKQCIIPQDMKENKVGVKKRKEKKVGVWGQTGLVLDMLSSLCLWDIQVVMWRRQLDI